MQIWKWIIFGMEAVTVRGLEKGGSLGGERGIWWELVGMGSGGGGVWLGEERRLGGGGSWKEV